MTDFAAIVADECRAKLWPSDNWFKPDGYPNSLALCVIDAIQSTGSHYTSVRNVVAKYRAFRAGRGGDGDSDGTQELLTTFGSCNGSDGWADSIGNRKPASTKRGASLKAEVIRQVADRLDAACIRATDDLRTRAELGVASEDERNAGKRLWTGIEAQSSGVTWEYA